MIKVQRYFNGLDDPDTLSNTNEPPSSKVGIIIGVSFFSILFFMALGLAGFSEYLKRRDQSDESKRWKRLQSSAPAKSFRKWCKADDHLAPTGYGDAENPPMCVICLELLLEEDNVRVLRCRHVYHTQCFDRWFAGHSVCPLCHGQILDEKQEK